MINFLMKEQYTAGFISYGVAFAFKLQAIFLLPFIVVWCVKERKVSLINLLWVPICMVVLSMGGILQGRAIGDVFSIYVNQADTYHRVSNNYPSFWNLLVNNFSTDFYEQLAPLCIGTALTALGLEAVMVLKGHHTSPLRLAFLMSYTAVFFMPAMYERYSYIYVVLELLLVILDKRTIPAYMGLLIIDMHTYGEYLFRAKQLPWLALVGINIAYFGFYFLFEMMSMRKSE